MSLKIRTALDKRLKILITTQNSNKNKNMPDDLVDLTKKKKLKKYN